MTSKARIAAPKVKTANLRTASPGVRDALSEEKIRKLANKGVFALGVCSVEALYYCSDAIEAVAHRQAESLGFKADEVIELAKTEALAVLKQNGLAERMAAKRSQRQLQDRMLLKLPSWGTDQIGVEIQHKDRLLADQGAIEDILGRRG